MDSPRIKIYEIILLILIIAGGGWWWQSYRGLSTDSLISVTSTPTSTVDTSTWTTYRNEKYGFEIKIPEDWTVTSEDDPVCFDQKNRHNLIDPADTCGVAIVVYEPWQGMTTAEYVDRRGAGNVVTITLGGEQAVMDKSTDDVQYPSIMTSVDHQGKTYRIITPFPDKVGPIYFAILSTFKFTK